MAEFEEEFRAVAEIVALRATLRPLQFRAVAEIVALRATLCPCNSGQ
jgi:hypothetical protein